MQIKNQILKIRAVGKEQRIKLAVAFICLGCCGLIFNFACYASGSNESPIIVNGDTVEYMTDSSEASASGNVVVVYKGAKLTCDKLSVNTQTKDASAEGNVKIEDPEYGIIQGPKMTYNFETKTGVILDAEFKSNPYFGKAKKIEKVSDTEFVAYQGYASTCDYDHPHYRIQSKEVKMFPGDKIQTRDNRFYIGDIPFFYLPFYNHSLKEPLMHVRVSPGQRKEWGGYVLSAWRYNLTENVNGRVYFDYRQKLGFAEGFGVNYDTKRFGKGDFKFYYTDEHPETLSIGEPEYFNRYLARLRHTWAIDSRTFFTTEYYKILDEKRKFAPATDGFLKEYFYREYEKESQPLSYVLLQHNFNYSSISVLFQDRTNHWFDYIEKKPEAIFSMPAYQLAQSPFYYSNETTVANFDRKGGDVGDDTTVARLDTLNKISIPMSLSIFRIAPFVAERGTFYDTGELSTDSINRAIFYSGVEASTKLYRVLNVKSNFLGMDVDGLRHIISPSVKFNYNHKPTVNSSMIRQIDSVDDIAANSSLYIELSNKLQTKRDGKSIDLVDFLVYTNYYFNSFDTTNNIKRTDEFSDIFMQLKMKPYAWLRVDFDSTYKRSGPRNNGNYGHFSDVNYDFNFDFAKERSFGIGQRYERNGSNEITAQIDWRINPKWKFSIYERYNASADTDLKRGLREQEYRLSRDMHCWIMDMVYNISKEDGHTIWFVFKLKAFPETEFDFDQNYHKPKSGAQ